jgi:hypothetical protein
MKRTLYLTLKKRWFNMIVHGGKREEYREIKEYWEKRLMKDGKIRQFEEVVFRNGYGKDSPKATFDLNHIWIGKGKEEWGAEKDKEYFVIRLGRLKSLELPDNVIVKIPNCN